MANNPFRRMTLKNLIEDLYECYGFDIVYDGHVYYFDNPGNGELHAMYQGPAYDRPDVVELKNKADFDKYYDTLKELMDNYVFHDGKSFKQLWNERNK